jgi:hypothetical protein
VGVDLNAQVGEDVRVSAGLSADMGVGAGARADLTAEIGADVGAVAVADTEERELIQNGRGNEHGRGTSAGTETGTSGDRRRWREPRRNVSVGGQWIVSGGPWAWR